MRPRSIPYHSTAHVVNGRPTSASHEHNIAGAGLGFVGSQRDEPIVFVAVVVVVVIVVVAMVVVVVVALTVFGVSWDVHSRLREVLLWRLLRQSLLLLL